MRTQKSIQKVVSWLLLLAFPLFLINPAYSMHGHDENSAHHHMDASSGLLNSIFEQVSILFNGVHHGLDLGEHHHDDSQSGLHHHEEQKNETPHSHPDHNQNVEIQDFAKSVIQNKRDASLEKQEIEFDRYLQSHGFYNILASIVNINYSPPDTFQTIQKLIRSHRIDLPPPASV